MTLLILSAKEEDAPALTHTIDLLRKELGEVVNLYICFNAWNSDNLSEYITGMEKAFLDNHVVFKYRADANTLNVDKIVESWNKGLRFAARQKEGAIVVPLKWPGEKFTPAAGLDIGPEVVLTKDMYSFSPKALKEVGVLDQNFFEKLFLLDYLLRARIKGLSIKYTQDIPLQELTLLEQFDTLKLGTKWGVPEEIDPADFWKWAENQKYEWQPSMYIP